MPVRLVVLCDGKVVTLKLTWTPMGEGGKFNLVSIDQMNNEQMVVVVQMEQLQGTHGEARNDGPPAKHVREVLGRYKDVFRNELLQELLPTRKIDHKIEMITRSEPPPNTPY